MDLKVFLSSTYKDLSKQREAVYAAIEGMGYHCVRMEDFPASERNADDYCRARIAACDLFICLVGHLHGSRPKGSDKSYTEREFDFALESGIERLNFIASEDFLVPAFLSEDDERRSRQRAFRLRAAQEGMPTTFTTAEELATKVTQALHAWTSRRGIRLPRRGKEQPIPPDPDLVHPYPLQVHFTGRDRERECLTTWLTAGEQPTFVLSAMGGMGKSALTWVWLQHDVLGLPLAGFAETDGLEVHRIQLPEEHRPDGVI